MKRSDKDLAFVLTYENIAWFENGKVRILDRRVYPAEIRFEICTTYKEVAQAIKDMVTQSAGPYTAAPMGMALAAYESAGLKDEERRLFIKQAAFEITNARPTTAARMGILCDECVNTAFEALNKGDDPCDAIINKTVEMNNERYDRINSIAGYLVEKIPDGGKVMTYCFAETIIGMMLRECQRNGKDIKLFCPETRPYFQGSRLTATVCKDMGFDVTVITDGMPAFVMKNEGIDVFTTAADAICVDGHVVNKVGTCNTAIAAKYFGVPYYVTGAPDLKHPTIDSVKIEMRDPNFTLTALGRPTAANGVKGYYPAFDITPPELVSGVVTEFGIYSSKDLQRYADEHGQSYRVTV